MESGLLKQNSSTLRNRRFFLINSAQACKNSRRSFCGFCLLCFSFLPAAGKWILIKPFRNLSQQPPAYPQVVYHKYQLTGNFPKWFSHFRCAQIHSRFRTFYWQTVAFVIDVKPRVFTSLFLPIAGRIRNAFHLIRQEDIAVSLLWLILLIMKRLAISLLLDVELLFIAHRDASWLKLPLNGRRMNLTHHLSYHRKNFARQILETLLNYYAKYRPERQLNWLKFRRFMHNAIETVLSYYAVS